MKFYRYLMFMSLLTAGSLSPLDPQIEQTDTTRMGLNGHISIVQEKRTVYQNRNGDWVPQNPLMVSKTQFNEAGYKTEERFYSGNGRYNTFEYDEEARMTARKEYNQWRLTSSLEFSFDKEGSESLQLQYNNEGILNSKIIRQFDTSGEKISEIHYDNKDNLVQRWERSQTNTGTIISHSPRWGGYEITRIDSHGRMTEMSKGSGDTLQKWTYDYDTRSRLKEALYTDGNSAFLPDLFSFRYDTRNKLIELSHSKTSGVPVAKRQYIYTGSTTTEIVEWYDREGILVHTWAYNYDGAGNVTEKEYRHAIKPFSSRWTYRYDKNNHITMVNFYDSEGRIFTATETTYDARGNKVMERSSGRGVANGYHAIYEYDTSGRLLETVRYDPDDRIQSRQSSRYDNMGNITESTYYNPDGSLVSSTTYLYDYDRSSNWIERKTLVTNNANETYNVQTEILSRTIRYYP